MVAKGLIKKGEYFDSVSLMLVSKELNKLEGIIDSAVVMGTAENKSILNTSGLLLPEFANAGDSDLIVVIKGESESEAENAFSKITDIFAKLRNKSESVENFAPKSIEGALKYQPDSNLLLISVAGKYASAEAKKALDNNLHVMIFSDNVSIEEELELKQLAHKKGLLLMGPDCGTAILNGIPLAFANVVNKGNIGIVGASGTGTQEVSCIISNKGGGISQAIGTGGRDVKAEIGGIMFLDAFAALKNDPETKVIVLVSKPPHESVQKKIAHEISQCSKPVVTILIGGNPEVMENAGAMAASSLEEAGLLAVALVNGLSKDEAKNLVKKSQNNRKPTEEEKNTVKGKYLRGLYSGGTLCDEAQLLLKDTLGYVYSNTPLNKDHKLENAWECKEHSIIDLGDDEFTVGRPHPMIDFELRNKKIIQEASNSSVGIILLDIVLGYGSNLNPEADIIPAIQNAKKNNNSIVIVCSITGTRMDPQNKVSLTNALEAENIIVFDSNASACRFIAELFS